LNAGVVESLNSVLGGEQVATGCKHLNAAATFDEVVDPRKMAHPL
jgi:hypothetical protein